MTAVADNIEGFPKGWNVSVIGDVADIKYGKSNPKTTGKVPLIGSSGIFGKVEKSLIDIPTIVVGRKGTAGSVQLVSIPSYPSDTTFYMVFNEKKPDLQFLYYFMSLYRLSGEHAKTTVPSIQKGDLENYKFPFPPLPEQKKIATVLSALQEAKEKTENVLSSLKELKKSMMKHLFTYGAVPIEEIGSVKLKETEIGLMPEKWRVAKLGDVVIREKGLQRGPWGGAIKKEIFVPYGYKIYEQGNAINNNFSIGRYYIDERKFNELIDFEVLPGDILISAAGTLGRLAIAPDGIERGIINQALLRVRLDAGKIDTLYFKYFFHMLVEKGTMEGYSHGATLKNLSSLKVLRGIGVPLPNIFEQQRIVDVLSTIDGKIEAEENKKNSLDALFKTLLSLLMTGKVRVNHLEI